MANNIDKPTIEAQAASVARLGEHVAEIHDPVLKTFIEQVMARVETLKRGAQCKEAEVIFISDPNEQQEKNV